MQRTQQRQRQTQRVSLRGSCRIVRDFFGHALASILFQRGLYPEAYFTPTVQYGVRLVGISDHELRDYVDGVLEQLELWLLSGHVKALILQVTDRAGSRVVCPSPYPLYTQTVKVRERWHFDVELDREIEAGIVESKTKSKSELRQEIQSLLRQITVAMSVLPLLQPSVPSSSSPTESAAPVSLTETPSHDHNTDTDCCEFELLVHAADNVPVPLNWTDDASGEQTSTEELPLREFSTSVHTVQARVGFLPDPTVS
ncbi:MAG: hypothetical protein MHM6MM_001786 [Cercozoa sp. M6MM]